VTWALPDNLAIDEQLCRFLEAYRANTLRFFLDRFEAEHHPGHRGGYFNVNSVTSGPYPHRLCFSWTDGRTLGELAASFVAELEGPNRLVPYMRHLYAALVERYRRERLLPLRGR